MANKVVVRDVDDGSLYVVMDNVWRFVDMFQHGIVTDEMRIFFKNSLDEDFGDLSFTAYECGRNGEEIFLVVDKFVVRFVTPRH